MAEKLNADIFEVALDGHWFSNGRDRKAYYHKCHAKPLVDAGFLEFEREVVHEYPEKPSDNWKEIYYRATPEGVAWWIEHRSKQVTDREGDPAKLEGLFEGQGMGTPITIYRAWHQTDVFAALRLGLVDFVSIDGNPWSPGMSFHNKITVRLNKLGYEYFGSLPKIEYDYNC